MLVTFLDLCFHYYPLLDRKPGRCLKGWLLLPRRLTWMVFSLIFENILYKIKSKGFFHSYKLYQLKKRKKNTSLFLFSWFWPWGSGRSSKWKTETFIILIAWRWVTFRQRAKSCCPILLSIVVVTITIKEYRSHPTTSSISDWASKLIRIRKLVLILRKTLSPFEYTY